MLLSRFSGQGPLQFDRKPLNRAGLRAQQARTRKGAVMPQHGTPETLDPEPDAPDATPAPPQQDTPDAPDATPAPPQQDTPDPTLLPPQHG